MYTHSLRLSKSMFQWNASIWGKFDTKKKMSMLVLIQIFFGYLALGILAQMQYN